MLRESHQAAGVVVYRDTAEGRSYLLLRSRLTRSPMWEFPKGGVEAGETERQTAERELHEETGLAPPEVEVLEGFRELERYFFTLGQGRARTLVVKQVTYFMARARTDRVLLSHEASDFRWAAFAEARRLVRFRAKQQVLDRAERWLSERGGERERVTATPPGPAPRGGGR
ncbi:MAG TPA: NUDIX domain-containing protein [Longimicrobiaceae bacterium]|nr:NUDIX domain-containing protein [Longimicrobiaceae bacterium]